MDTGKQEKISLTPNERNTDQLYLKVKSCFLPNNDDKFTLRYCATKKVIEKNMTLADAKLTSQKIVLFEYDEQQFE